MHRGWLICNFFALTHVLECNNFCPHLRSVQFDVSAAQLGNIHIPINSESSCSYGLGKKLWFIILLSSVHVQRAMRLGFFSATD